MLKSSYASKFSHPVFVFKSKMILAVECSGKTQCHTPLPAAVTACFADICRIGGDENLVSSRPTRAEDLDQFEPPRAEGIHWHSIIPKHYKNPFVCGNEAILQLTQINGSFYQCVNNERMEVFFQRVAPRLRALAANERILCKFLSDAIDHFKKGTVSLEFVLIIILILCSTSVF
eukprot:Gregarina_sp_Poly_1__10002@NODE_666_length_6870_cov_29_636925_g504_i0_p4_GENE_NODE_666_length_6870_cov_29_636925_g504_i0NODE_666_length_6870_cov_29_636925_g504_i0_p4_ORF_typecomplete_len175_score7_57_NODE_666_length_6870_cov_29_636925_g504_i045615085